MYVAFDVVDVPAVGKLVRVVVVDDMLLYVLGR